MGEGKSVLMKGPCQRAKSKTREDCTFFGDDELLINIPQDVIKFNFGASIKKCFNVDDFEWFCYICIQK